MTLAQLSDVFSTETWNLIYLITLGSPGFVWIIVTLTMFLIATFARKSESVRFKRYCLRMSIGVVSFYSLVALSWWCINPVPAWNAQAVAFLEFGCLLLWLTGPLIALGILLAAVYSIFFTRPLRVNSLGFPVEGPQ